MYRYFYYFPKRDGRKSKKLLKHPFQHFTFVLAKNLGMSQRRLVKEMGADEITDWMAYELSNSPEFIEKINSEPQNLAPEEEAAAIKAMFMGLSK